MTINMRHMYANAQTGLRIGTGMSMTGKSTSSRNPDDPALPLRMDYLDSQVPISESRWSTFTGFEM